VAKPSIRIIPPGADSFVKEKEINIRILEKHAHLISVMGRWQDHKNVGFAIEQLARLNDSSMNKYHIALIGKSNVIGRKTVEETISRVDPSKISLIEYLEPGELNWIFAHSKIVVIPSLNEGFGMPSFEAYMGGATILVHKGTPISSILHNQKGVFSCDMSNPEDFIQKVRDILNLEIVIQNSERKKVIEELKLTWNSYGERVAELYRELSIY
jgi:glycosyltransferase involved in cell wall biosynthesis